MSANMGTTGQDSTSPGVNGDPTALQAEEKSGGNTGRTITFDEKNGDINSGELLETVPSRIDEAKDIRGQDIIIALGIPDWQAKEKKILRILDCTLLPQLWILYMFNYLNRTNIAYERSLNNS